MNHTKPEPRLERIVVSVVMKKMMTVKQAQGGNEAVDGFSNSHSLRSEGLVMLRCRDGERYPACRKDFKLFQRGTRGLKFSWRTDPQEHFAQDEICQAQPLPADFPVKPISLRCGLVPEIINPHGRVNQRHEASGIRPCRDSSRFPSQ